MHNIIGFDDYYINESGEVFSKRTGKIKKMKLHTTQKGYKEVELYGKTYKVHRLVAKTYIPNPNNLPQVNHKNGNKQDNSVDNLEWCDNSYNQKHAWENGLHKPHKPKNRVLTDKLAEQIRFEYKTTKISHRELANKYNVSKTTIGDLLRGKYYKNK